MPTRAGLQLNEFCEIQCDCSARDIVAGGSLRLILASLILASLIGYHLAGTARESRVRWTRTTRCSKNAPFLIDFQIWGRIFGALDAFSMLAGAYCLALGSVHVYTYICIYIYMYYLAKGRPHVVPVARLHASLVFTNQGCLLFVFGLLGLAIIMFVSGLGLGLPQQRYQGRLCIENRNYLGNLATPSVRQLGQ